MQINAEQSSDEILSDTSKENSNYLINTICNKLKNICTLTCQIPYPKIQVKKIKKNSIYFKKQKDSQTKPPKTHKDVKKKQFFCQTSSDLKILEYLSQLTAIENLQHKLEKVKELIYLFE